jgi:hypothetical protein
VRIVSCIHEQEPQNRYDVQINLAQELLLSRRVNLILQSISVGFDSRVFDVQLFQLVVCNVRIHLTAGSPEEITNKTTGEAGMKGGEFAVCRMCFVSTETVPSI